MGGSACGGRERCCRHGTLGCPITDPGKEGCLSGAKKPEPCKGPPTPTPPGPPPPPPLSLPELFPNLMGTPTEGQVYPNTLIDLPEQDRMLVHASASTHQHGFGVPAPVCTTDQWHYLMHICSNCIAQLARALVTGARF